MRKIQILIVTLLFFAITVHVSCSGATGDTIGDTVGDTIVVHESSSIPAIDISGIDIVSPPSGSINKMAGPGIGDPSSTGCVATKFFRPLTQDTLKQSDLASCIVKKTQQASGEFTIPKIESDSQDSYRYYQIVLGAGTFEKTGIKTIRTRVANVSVESSNTFKMDICQSTDGSSFVRTNQLEARGILSSHTWLGRTIAHNLGNFGDTSCTSTPCNFDGASFEIVMDSEDDLGRSFSWSNATSAIISSYHGKNPSSADVEDATTFGNSLSAVFTHEAVNETLGVAKQTITGVYDSPADGIKSSDFAAYTADTGASKIAHDNGQGVYYTTQAYNPSTDFPKIIDLETVSFYGDVADATLPSTDLGDSVRQAVAFTNSWDCEAHGEYASVEIDASALDLSECENMVTTLSKPGVETVNQCFGSVSWAGDYRGRATPAGGVCLIATNYTLNGSGPAYAEGTGSDLVQIIYDNGYCVSASKGALFCWPCETDTTLGTISMTRDDGCTYELQRP